VNGALLSLLNVTKGLLGTGKIQTTLNIIADAMINDQSVAVISIILQRGMSLKNWNLNFKTIFI
jgi:hypothetical protein